MRSTPFLLATALVVAGIVKASKYDDCINKDIQTCSYMVYHGQIDAGLDCTVELQKRCA